MTTKCSQMHAVDIGLSESIPMVSIPSRKHIIHSIFQAAILGDVIELVSRIIAARRSPIVALRLIRVSAHWRRRRVGIAVETTRMATSVVMAFGLREVSGVLWWASV